MEAATSTISSKSSPVATPAAVSRTTVSSGRRTSTCSRTIRFPVRAVVGQWIRRGSSPGTYSRSDTKPESGSTVARRTDASLSVVRIDPDGASSTWTRGCTMIVARSSRTVAPTANPNGSRRTTATGPSS